MLLSASFTVVRRRRRARARRAVVRVTDGDGQIARVGHAAARADRRHRARRGRPARARACGSTGGPPTAGSSRSTARPTRRAEARARWQLGESEGRRSAEADPARRRARRVHGHRRRPRRAAVRRAHAARLRDLRRLAARWCIPTTPPRRPARSACRATSPSRPTRSGTRRSRTPRSSNHRAATAGRWPEAAPNPVVLPGRGLPVRSRPGLRGRAWASSGCTTGR